MRLKKQQLLPFRALNIILAAALSAALLLTGCGKQPAAPASADSADTSGSVSVHSESSDSVSAHSESAGSVSVHSGSVRDRKSVV